MSEQMPIMRNYLAIKREIPQGTILLFRRGNFLEALGEDAELSSTICGLVLTRKNDTPMCRFSALSICSYLTKFTLNGKSVAIAEMVELGQYEVVRIVKITPGTAEKENVK